MDIKAVIFDYGGVICFHPPETEFEALASLAGAPKEAFLETYWGLRLKYDRGDVTFLEYWNNVARRVGRSYSNSEIDELVRGDIALWLHVDGRMIRWARELKESGCKIGLLSNMPRELGEYMLANVPWMHEFDHVTLSYAIRSVKPEPAIYHECLEGLGVRPEETAFLDDRIENIKGAKELGIRAMLFESAESFSRSAREAHHFMDLGTVPVVLE